MSFKAITFSLAVSAVALLAAAPRAPTTLRTSWPERSSAAAPSRTCHLFAAPDTKTREMVGFDVDLCNEIAKRWGVTAKVTPL